MNVLSTLGASDLPRRDPFIARGLLRGIPCGRALNPRYHGTRVYSCGEECHEGVDAQRLEHLLFAGARERAWDTVGGGNTVTGHELLRAALADVTVDESGQLQIQWRTNTCATMLPIDYSRNGIPDFAGHRFTYDAFSTPPDLSDLVAMLQASI